MAETTPLVMSSKTPAATDVSEDERSGPSLPSAITGPIEAVLSTVGSSARTATGWISSHSQRATSRAVNWLEFFDITAFGLDENGIKGHMNRLKMNTSDFFFNYIIIGLVITVLSVITHPIALVSAAILIWVYFQFWGVEHAGRDYEFFGFSLNDSEKLGTMVFLGAIVFWFTAGGFEIFMSILSAILVVTVIHGSFRKPRPQFPSSTSADTAAAANPPPV